MSKSCLILLDSLKIKYFLHVESPYSYWLSANTVMQAKANVLYKIETCLWRFPTFTNYKK